MQPDYQFRTVSVDGWAATHQAWRALYPLVVLLRCFQRGWLNLRSRGKLSAAFADLSRKVWEAFRTPDRPNFAQRQRRSEEWARDRPLTAWLLEQVEQLCGQAREYGAAYQHPGGHRTGTMLGQLMRAMSRYFEVVQHLHGSVAPCALHCRGWALPHNFRPRHPTTARVSRARRSGSTSIVTTTTSSKNLLVSASPGGYRCENHSPHKP